MHTPTDSVRRRPGALLIAFVLAPLAGCSAAESADTRSEIPPPSAYQVAVVISPDGFQPQSELVNAGDRVLFENQDTVQHTIAPKSSGTSGCTGLSVGTIEPGGNVMITMSQPGVVCDFADIDRPTDIRFTIEIKVNTSPSTPPQAH